MKKNGVYFGLSEAEYFAEPRIGSTLLRTLIDEPARFWWESYLNPNRKDKTAKCLREGKIFHKLILEGEKALSADFAIAPRGLSPASKEYKNWARTQIRPIVKSEEVDAALQVHKHLAKTTLGGFFKGGYPEVSILWTDEDGNNRAARIDYLKVGQLLDLKSFDGMESPAKYAWKYKVFVQLMDYIEALKAARTLPVVKGTPKQKEFWAQCAQVDEWLPWIVFVNRSLPQYMIKTLIPEHCPELYRAGRSMIEKAKQNLKQYMDRFGPTHAWIDEPTPDELAFKDFDFPQLASYEI